MRFAMAEIALADGRDRTSERGEASPERRLAAHVAALRWADVPAGTRARLGEITVDLVACLLAGLRSPACRAIACRRARQGGLPQASMVGMAGAVPAAAAAFVNAALAHWYEADDVHDAAALHASAVILPALLAVAEATGRSDAAAWPEVAVALIGAFDVAGRVGEAVVPWTGSSWMPTGIACTVGAAAGTARLLGLGEAGIASAMGLAAAGGGLLRQPLIDKVDGKNVLCAQAASRALEAAELAADGVTGAQLFLTGEFGLDRVFAERRADFSPGLGDLGRRFTLDELSLKPYPSCRASHPAIGLALDLAAEQGLVADDVASVEVVVPRPMFEMCGAPFAPGDDPRVSAQFSIAYTVALALLRGRLGFGDFEADAVRDAKDVAGLAARVVTTPVPLAPGRRVLGQPVAMRVTTIDGRRFERTSDVVPGSPARPMTVAEQAAKLRDAAGDAVDDVDGLAATARDPGAHGLGALMARLRSARWMCEATVNGGKSDG
jgi:2-methylcitrate dehydratase PrpD